MTGPFAILKTMTSDSALQDQGQEAHQSRKDDRAARLMQGDAGRLTGRKQGLTARQKLLIAEFMKNGNKVAAYRAVGGLSKYADTRAAEAFNRPAVKAEIERLMNERMNEAKVTAEKIEARYAEIAFAKFEGQLLAGHVLEALKALGNIKGVFRPETVTMIPVQFNITGGPSLNVDNGGFAPTDRRQSPTDSQLTVTNTQDTMVNLLSPDKPIPRGK